MDGYEAAKKIRELTKDEEILIYSITGHTDLSDSEKAYESGMNKVLEKPLQY